MKAIHLPVGRNRGQIAERAALRRGLAAQSSQARPLRLVPRQVAQEAAYCAACAGPIEFGAVLRFSQAFCSVECSLGSRPA